MKVIFVHIPKTGGRSATRDSRILSKIIQLTTPDATRPGYMKELENYMIPRGLSANKMHSRWIDSNPKIRDTYKAVAIVRNPWSRVISRYMQYSRVKKNPPMLLEEWLEKRHQFDNLPYYWHRAIDGWYQQLDYVVDEDRKLRCDILRFEHFDNDLFKYFDIRGKKIKPVGVGNINKKDYRDFYNEVTKQIVSDWYKDDINFFGFNFSSPATKNIWRLR